MIEGVRHLLAGLVDEGLLPDVYRHAFMARAFLATLLLAPLLGLLSPIVVTQRLAFFSSTIGQASLTGVALGLLMGEPISHPIGGVFGFCLLMALALAFVRRHAALPSDTVIGVFMAFSLGLGICLLIAVTQRFNIHQVEGVLFGSIMTMEDVDLLVALGTLIGGGLMLLPRVRGLLVSRLDSTLAASRRLSRWSDDYILMLTLALVIVACLKLTGALLVEALVVVPAATARLVSKSLTAYFGWSVVVAFVASQVGLLASGLLPLPAGAAMVLALACLFALVFALSTLRRSAVTVVLLTLAAGPLASTGHACTCEKSPVTVLATFQPLYSIAATLTEGIEDLRVVYIAPPSASPAMYDPRSADVRGSFRTWVQRADALLTLRTVALAPPFDDLYGAARAIKIRIVELDPLAQWTPSSPTTPLLPTPRDYFDPPGEPTGINPHVWLAPSRAARMVRRLAADLAQLSPTHQNLIARRARALSRRFFELRSRALAALADLDTEGLIVLSEAFPYLLADLDLTVDAALFRPPDETTLYQALTGLQARLALAEEEPPASLRRALKRAGTHLVILDTIETATPAPGGGIDPHAYARRLEEDVRRLVEAFGGALPPTP